MASILIIDDDANLAAPLAEVLRRDGHEAEYVPGVREALAHLHGNEPDLILLDLSMPRTDGLELLDAIREEPRLSDVRVAVYTGRTDEASRETAKKLGACDYIVKGPNWDEIYARIKAQLPPETTVA
jgi:DNA-binding response OmpR family regulator